MFLKTFSNHDLAILNSTCALQKKLNRVVRKFKVIVSLP